MTEYQITSWRELPSMVTARDGADTSKTPMPPRFQEAIDEAAMRVGAIDADAYLEGWTRSAWTATEGSPADVCDRVSADLEADWPDDKVTAYLDAIGPASS